MIEYATVVNQSRFRAVGPYLLMDSTGYPLVSPEILQGAVTYEYVSPVPAHVPTLYSLAWPNVLCVDWGHATMLLSEEVLAKDWDTPEEDEAWKDL